MNIVPLIPSTDTLGTSGAQWGAVHALAYYQNGAALARADRKLDDFGTPDDNTDLDATTSRHGLMSKLDKVKLDAIDLSQITDGDMAKATYDPTNVGGDAFAMANMQGTVSTAQIGDAQVTLAKMANLPGLRILGNNSAASAVPAALTATQVRALINVADGANLYVHPDHTGDVTSSADGATTIADGAVTLAKMADLAEALIIGRAAGAGTGAPAALTPAEVRTLINVADGATAFNPASPGAIGDTTPGTAKFTEIAGGPGREAKIKFGDYGSSGSVIIEGTGTGMNAITLLELMDAAGTRIGYLYCEPTTGNLSLLNERAGGLKFGSNGSDRLTIYSTGGAHFGNAPSDPGANNFQVQGNVIAAGATIQNTLSATSIENGNPASNFYGLSSSGWHFGQGYLHKIGISTARANTSYKPVFVFSSDTIAGWIDGVAANTGTMDLAISRNAAGVAEINNGTIGTFRDLKLRNLFLSGGVIVIEDFTVATLPTASTVPFGEAVVTDANAPSVGSIVASGGSDDCKVMSNGTNWIVTALL